MMALSDAVQGSNHTAQSITWTDEDGNAVDLTSATLTGKLREWGNESASATDIDGALALSDASNGVFTWTYGTNDVGTAGAFAVTFVATFPDTSKEKSIIEKFVVREALDV